MNTEITSDMEVSAEAFYLPEHSDADKNDYRFGYRIKLRNTGQETLQLLTRHWVISDSNGHVFHIHGDGVIGMQPTIKPGEEFNYESSSLLHSPVGTMEGEYQMINEHKETFKIKIPMFSLSVPNIVN